jgi:hypothetical protein
MLPNSEAIDRAVAGFPAALGAKVRERRKAAKFSEDDLARMLSLTAKLSLSGRDIAALEAGKIKNPDIRLLTALMFVLELSVDQLLVSGLSDKPGR